MLRTTIAGSLPKPAWLARPEMLWAPWALPPDTLASGQRDAVLIALKEQEAAGIDVVTDGEQSRQHFVHGFLERLDGIDFGKRVTIGIRADRYKAEVPTVTGPIARRRPIHLDEVRWARAHTDRRLKFTIPGPMTIVDTLADEHYRDRRQLAMEFARVINEEARDLVMAGLDVLQLDEPAFNVYMDDVAGWGIAALHRAIEGLACTTAVHICYGYGIKANIDWKQTLGARMASVRADVPAAGAEPHRSGLPGVRELEGAAVAAGAAGRQGRAGRLHRRGESDDRDARGGGGHHSPGARARAARAALSLHQLRNGAAVP